MKSIRKHILFFCILIPALVYGQDWQCFKYGITSNYSNQAGDFRTVHFCGTSIGNGFVYFMNFESLIFSGPGGYEGCYIPGPSWIGKYMVTDGFGNNYFFTSTEDTICIRTDASAGDSWVFAGNDSIQIVAYISTEDISIILGEPDSTKTISFQSYNNEGDTIFTPLDAIVLILSKNHGLVNSIDFYNFSFNNPYIYNLAGISEPLLGLQNLTSNEVFSFSPGDVFHTEEVFFNTAGCFRDVYYTVNQILDSIWAPSSDSVIYRIARTILNLSGHGELYNTYNRDTIYQTYVFDQLEYINSYPGQVNYNEYDTGYFSEINYLHQSSTSNYNFRRAKSSLRDWIGYFNCITAGDNQTKKYFIEGCGEYFYAIYNKYGLKPSRHYRQLQYYSKVSDTWGIPFDTTTWHNFVSISDYRNYPNQLFLYPNPASNIVTLEISPFDNSSSYRLKVYAVAGNKTDEMIIPEKSFTFSAGKYAPGIYFLIVYKDGKIAGNQKLVRF